MKKWTPLKIFLLDKMIRKAKRGKRINPPWDYTQKRGKSKGEWKKKDKNKIRNGKTQ
jgi:hypothetical protein